MSSLPCISYQIQDVVLFRTFLSPFAISFTSRPYITMSLPSELVPLLEANGGKDQLRTFEITQGYGTSTRLVARRFDITDVERAANTESPLFYSHPYTLADVAATTAILNQFVQDSVITYVKEKVPLPDRVTWSVFQVAIQEVKDKAVRWKPVLLARLYALNLALLVLSASG